MDDVDFRLWMKHHNDAYPGLAAWLKSNPGQVKTWKRILVGFELDELIKATDSLVERLEQPRGYSDHPRDLKAIVLNSRGTDGRKEKRRGPIVKDGHLVAKCPICMDHGIVSILSPKTISALDSGECKGLNTCCCACKCEAGEEYLQGGRLRKYGTTGYPMVVWEHILDAGATELVGHTLEEVAAILLEREREQNG